jgi:hypothetical protein
MSLMTSIAETPWGLFLLLLLAAVIVIVAVVSSRARTSAGAPRPTGDNPTYPINPRPLPPKVDTGYRASVPSSAASPQTVDSDSPDQATRTRPPRRVVNCPRCRQAILNDESLAERRVICPICNCKFFLPRDT